MWDIVTFPSLHWYPSLPDVVIVTIVAWNRINSLSLFREIYVISRRFPFKWNSTVFRIRHRFFPCIRAFRRFRTQIVCNGETKERHGKNWSMNIQRPRQEVQRIALARIHPQDRIARFRLIIQVRVIFRWGNVSKIHPGTISVHRSLITLPFIRLPTKASLSLRVAAVLQEFDTRSTQGTRENMVKLGTHVGVEI